MAARLGKRISRAVKNAIRARDRAELRTMDALLSLVESPRGEPGHPNAQALKPLRRRIRRQMRSG